MPGGSDEETLFARNEAGKFAQVRVVRKDDRDVKVHLNVDGDATRRVPKAVACTDAQGNPILNPDGSEPVRWSTVLDAVGPGPIPTLCHQPHLTPIGVCRVCVVGLEDVARPGRVRLLPACQHPVFQRSAADETGGQVRMAVHTLFSPTDRHRLTVRGAVAGVFELLAGDHVHPASPAPRTHYHNELIDVADTLLASWERFPPAPGTADEAARGRVRALHAALHPNVPGLPRPAARYGGREHHPGRVDNRVGFPFVVDRNNCVLCDRCVRACGVVRPFRVIGRSGKGAGTEITFDRRGLPMADSSCRACGECMSACPTGAITFREPVRAAVPPPPPPRGLLPAVPVSAAELRARFEFLRRVPLAFLMWNEGAVRRRPFRLGDVLARQDEFGTVAFVITAGEVGVYRRGVERHGTVPPADLRALEALPGWPAHGTPLNVIRAHPANLVGEMSPMSHDRRLATLVGLGAGEVLEVERNVLHVLLRDPARRAAIDDDYRRRAILDVFDLIDARSRDAAAADLLFGGPDPAVRASLAAFVTDPARLGELELLRYEPGQVVCAQGEDPAAADDPRRDGVFLIRLGFVGVAAGRPGREEQTLLPMSRPQCVGDLAVLSRALWTPDEWAERWCGIPDPPVRGFRAATCTALGRVELVRIPTAVFEAWLAAEARFHPYLRDRCLRVWDRRWR